MASIVQYWTGAVWTAEANVISIAIRDTLQNPMSLVVLISNPDNTREATYTDYQRIRVIEENTSQVLFYGKVEGNHPYWDEIYGQVLEVRARDNLQELLKRLIVRSYTGYVRRSALIAQVVADYSYAGNISTADAAKFVASPIAEPAAQLDVNFDGSGKNALRAIAEIAVEDPWNATPTGFAADYYLDTTFAGASPTPAMHYFVRGTRPAGGASANGLTVQFGGTEGNQVRAMLPDYAFTSETRELVTILTISYVDTSGASQSLSVSLLNISGIVGTFTVGETITGGTSGVTAVVQYSSTSFLAISGWSGLWTIGETITGGTSGATATVSSVPRQTYQQDIEVVTREYDVSALAEARDKAAELLYHGGAQIRRGSFSIVRWPYFTIGPTTTLVRCGDVVRVVNANSSINADMLVTSVIYDEGPGIQHARMEVVGTARGVSVPPHVLTTVLRDAETAQWESTGSMGGLPIASQIVNLSSVFTVVDNDDISWLAGTATFADGSTLAINAGSLNLSSASIYYLYIIAGNSALQNTTSFSTVVGVNRSLVAIAQRVTDTTQRAKLVTMNDGTPQLVAGTLIANELSAITANMGLLTAGEVRVGTGAVGVNFTGFRMFGNYFAGYNNDVLQAYLQASDGRFRGAAGSVIIDADGVHIVSGSGSTAFLNLESPAGSVRGRLFADATTISIAAATDINLILSVGGTGIVRPATAGQDFGSASLYWDGFFNDLYGQTIRPLTGSVITIDSIEPISSVFDTLGATLNAWATLYVQDIRRGTAAGAGGDIGTATEYFNNLYIGQTRNRITGSAGDIDFRVNNTLGSGDVLAFFIRDGDNPEVTLGLTSKLDLSTRNIKNFAFQATVGSAGAASALPANPEGYAEIEVDGVARVFPYYKKS